MAGDINERLQEARRRQAQSQAEEEQTKAEQERDRIENQRRESADRATEQALQTERNLQLAREIERAGEVPEWLRRIRTDVWKKGEVTSDVTPKGEVIDSLAYSVRLRRLKTDSVSRQKLGFFKRDETSVGNTESRIVERSFNDFGRHTVYEDITSQQDFEGSTSTGFIIRANEQTNQAGIQLKGDTIYLPYSPNHFFSASDIFEELKRVGNLHISNYGMGISGNLEDIIRLSPHFVEGASLFSAANRQDNFGLPEHYDRYVRETDGKKGNPRPELLYTSIKMHFRSDQT